MKLKEISKTEFLELVDLNDIYYRNGILFNILNDEVVAFEKIEDDNSSYWIIDDGDN